MSQTPEIYVPCKNDDGTYACAQDYYGREGINSCSNCLKDCFVNDKGETYILQTCGDFYDKNISCSDYGAGGPCIPTPILAQQQQRNYSTSSNGKQNGKQKQENYWIWILIVAGLLLFIFLMYVLSKKLQKK